MMGFTTHRDPAAVLRIGNIRPVRRVVCQLF